MEPTRLLFPFEPMFLEICEVREDFEQE